MLLSSDGPSELGASTASAVRDAAPELGSKAGASIAEGLAWIGAGLDVIGLGLTVVSIGNVVAAVVAQGGDPGITARARNPAPAPAPAAPAAPADPAGGLP
ncbi:hypothetical protein HYH03_017188 [Edaphochlamys debaryana]|uniref:Uncharacterized protein n=1 Tax=Edaphochlamys debaryana TaxID=47281 RepID=A0A835XG77_9CHLO|nr:hypothetical protein HYH03_017188 [Edaphochlamys debaryana]|eukprot:KAG2484022.1 hypothetical protein HYH03_017188 [Edaphochlamys debaryana]